MRTLPSGSPFRLANNVLAVPILAEMEGGLLVAALSRASL